MKYKNNVYKMTRVEIETEFEEWNENGYWVRDEVIDFATYVMGMAIAKEREECTEEIRASSETEER